MTTGTTTDAEDGTRRLGHAWLALCAALALHVADEAMTGFLSVYNPTVLKIREALPFLPLPVFRFDVWIIGLIGAVAALVALSRYVFQGRRWTRWAAGVFAAFMVLNALGHTAGTLLGRTVETVRFVGPMPGFYSSPFLAVASLYLLWQLRRSKPIAQPACRRPR